MLSDVAFLDALGATAEVGIHTVSGSQLSRIRSVESHQAPLNEGFFDPSSCRRPVQPADVKTFAL